MSSRQRLIVVDHYGPSGAVYAAILPRVAVERASAKSPPPRGSHIRSAVLVDERYGDIDPFLGPDYEGTTRLWSHNLSGNVGSTLRALEAVSAWLTAQAGALAPSKVPGTRVELPTVVLLAAMEIGRLYDLTERELWLVAVATKHPRLREAAKQLGLGLRVVEDRSAEVGRHASSSFRDVVVATMWKALEMSEGRFEVQTPSGVHRKVGRPDAKIQPLEDERDPTSACSIRRP